MYDNYLLGQMKESPRQGNTVALTMVINVVLKTSMELLMRGFDLDLY